MAAKYRILMMFRLYGLGKKEGSANGTMAEKVETTSPQCPPPTTTTTRGWKI
jgi:hypothetical protein